MQNKKLQFEELFTYSMFNLQISPKKICPSPKSASNGHENKLVSIKQHFNYSLINQKTFENINSNFHFIFLG